MQISIIGCGSMGSGLAQHLSQKNQLFFYDRHIEKTKALADKGYGKICKQVQEAAQSGQIVFLAVKPQNLKDTAGLIGESLRENQLLVSLLAGVPFSLLRHHFPSVRLVRMMPNLPLIHGEGVIGLSGSLEGKQS